LLTLLALITLAGRRAIERRLTTNGITHQPRQTSEEKR
jgi:hypothetical protein